MAVEIHRPPKPRPSGNILGNVRAEADIDSLQSAFIETSDFRALTQTADFNFVVGRRGTGKTALYLKVGDALNGLEGCATFRIRPEEHDFLTMQASLARMEHDYRQARAAYRMCWQVSMLLTISSWLLKQYKVSGAPGADFLAATISHHRKISELPTHLQASAIIAEAAKAASSMMEIPGIIATTFDFAPFRKAVSDSLKATGFRGVFLFDGLDEGWEPSPRATALTGGLCAAAADIRDARVPLHPILFIRDNIFRALAHFDPDFSRHIEGSTLRLHWDEQGLLHLVAARLRQPLAMEATENDIKIWNRFAQRELQDRAGFRHCLQYTLYRPRDILVLLNQSYLLAARQGREHIVPADVEAISRDISRDRLDDLLKEYDTVLPGLRQLVRAFEGQAAIQQIGQALGLLAETLSSTGNGTSAASDFAILGSPNVAYQALFGIGFLGFEDPTTGALTFRHDGAKAEAPMTETKTRVAVHPCYWRALDSKNTDIPIDVLGDIHDDYKVESSELIRDVRFARLGQIVGELPNMPMGAEGAQAFEDWTLQSVKILFAGGLENAALKPNGSAVQRRDVVARNVAERGFWRRIFEDYGSRQVVFEVKNKDELDPGDIRQSLSYTGGPYGNFIILVFRGEGEGLAQTERAWVKEIWDQHRKLVFILPASVLVRSLRKMRRPDNASYADEGLAKRLDTFERKYLSLPSPSRRRPRRKHK